MTNENQQMNTSEQKTAPFGARLKSAREALGLERKDAAAQLRLNENLIVMMEKDKYPDDLPITFIRGYIRAYGKLLQIPDLEIRKAIEPIGPSPSAILPLPTIKPTLFEPVTSSNYFMQLATYIIGITIVGLACIWWYTRTPSPTQPLNAIPVEKPSMPVTPTPPPAVINQNTAQQPVDNLPPSMSTPSPQTIGNDKQLGQIPPSAANHPTANEPAVMNQPANIPQAPPETPAVAAPSNYHQEQAAQLYATPTANPGPQQLDTAPPAPPVQAPAPMQANPNQQVAQPNEAPLNQQIQPNLPVPLDTAQQPLNETTPSNLEEQHVAEFDKPIESTPKKKPRKHARSRPRYVDPEIEVLPDTGDY